jgi:hypothetical protein
LVISGVRTAFYNTLMKEERSDGKKRYNREAAAR